MRYNGKIFRQIWKKYSETIFLIDSNFPHDEIKETTRPF